MAYFANSTEGMVLDQQCIECRIGIENACPVAFVQGCYNYFQMKDGNEKLRDVLNLLVDEDGKCQMKIAIDQNIPDRRG